MTKITNRQNLLNSTNDEHASLCLLIIDSTKFTVDFDTLDFIISEMSCLMSSLIVLNLR